MNIVKSIAPLLLLLCSLSAKDLTPSNILKLSGGSTDMSISDNHLYVATIAGKIDIFDTQTKQQISTISVPKIKDFVGDLIESKIYSVDVLNNNVLIVSQGEKGGRDIFVYKNSQLNTLISAQKRLYIARAKFISDDKIIFSTLSNQLYMYDLKQNKILYDHQISQSKFSYFVLNETKDAVIVADESGDLSIIETKTGKITNTLNNQNLDNVFQVDWKNGTILTAGQDRQSVLYSGTDLQPYIRKSTFLIYGCALSKDGGKAAYSSDEQNNVTIFDTQSKQDLYTLTNNKMTISKILFLNNNEILVGTDAKVINIYKLQ